MCPIFPQFDILREFQGTIPRPPPRPEGLRQGIRDPNIPLGKAPPPRIATRDIEAEPAAGWDDGPYAAPCRPKHPDTGPHVSRGGALRRPDLDPRRSYQFSRPTVPTTFSWEQLPKPPSAQTRKVPAHDGQRAQSWATALLRRGSPHAIREDSLPGEALVANWPVRQRRSTVMISAVDALRGAEEIRLRILGRRAIAVVCRGPLSFFVTIAFGETPDSPAHFTPAGAILSAPLKAEVRQLLHGAGLLAGTEWRFVAALGRCRDIERQVWRHLAAAHDAATRQTWTDMRAELVAANDVAAPLRHPAAAIRLGPALDPELYGEGPRPKTRRRDAEHAAKAVLGRLAHAVRRLERHASHSQETETSPLAAE